LAGLAESEPCEGLKRLSVRNGGIPFNPSLPGTPNSINEQPSYKWSRPGTVSPPSPDTLSLSSSPEDAKDTAYPSDQGQKMGEDGPETSYVLDDVPRMVCVDAI
jgi:hypothetical protein